MATSEWIEPPPRSTPCVLPPDTSLFSSCLAPPERLAYRIRSMCGTVPRVRLPHDPRAHKPGEAKVATLTATPACAKLDKAGTAGCFCVPRLFAPRPACTRAWGVLVCSYISYITPSYQIGSTVNETRAVVNRSILTVCVVQLMSAQLRDQ